MAPSEQAHRITGLRLNTGNQNKNKENGEGAEDAERSPEGLRQLQASDETVKPVASQSISIVGSKQALVEAEQNASSHDPAVEQYLRNRKPSISFSNDLILDTGHRQSMKEPLQKPAKNRPRGRSLLQAISDERSRAARAHSESDRTQYDPITGRRLPEYSNLPPQDLAHVGEGRFPLLQSTVDELARESQTDLPNAMSMTSASTISPTSDEIQTPQDDKEAFILSPTSGSSYQYASSYDEPRRRASQRWREGQTASEFFTRAGSLRKEGRRPSRRDTSGSTRSPRSAASSFLRAFSMGSGGEAHDGPQECDAEGQTIGDDYVLGKQIGFGGFSIIKEVTHMREDGDQRKLAVKIVRRNISGKSDEENEQVQAEFDHEVELWRFLNNPRILPLEAVYKTEEATFCFIPLNTGGTLFDVVRSNRQGLKACIAKRYSYHLASALRYLHCDARVVHRDVKLENCLVDTSKGPPGDVRLCDFGMAEWISNYDSSGPPSPSINSADRPPLKNIGPADTSTSAFAGGSLEYAAPEILRIAEATENGETERSMISSAVDIWAFGVCVYCMVVGSRPFNNAFQPRIVMAILAGDWDRRKLREKGGEDCLELVSGCLEMEAMKRWDVQDVLGCRWLSEVSEKEEQDDEEQSKRTGDGGNAGWRL